jgi:hypothetical protein
MMDTTITSKAEQTASGKLKANIRTTTNTRLKHKTNLLARNHELEAVEVGERGASLLSGELLCPRGGGPLGGDVGGLPSSGQGGLTANVSMYPHKEDIHEP